MSPALIPEQPVIVVGSLYIALAYDPLVEAAPLVDHTLAELFAHWPLIGRA
jgi:hypothetical protein